MSEQFDLDLGDEYEYTVNVMCKHEPLGTNSTWKIFHDPIQGRLFVGIRTHFIETDYSYVKEISLETAEKLIAGDKRVSSVREFLSAVADYKADLKLKKQVATNSKGA